MADQANPKIIEYLEHIRDKVDSIDVRFGSVEVRVGSLENDFLTLARTEAGRNIDFQAIIRRVDSLETRLAKLERTPRPPAKAAQKKRKPGN
ncbi:MAG: hypothetical protein AAFR23_04475 [Pseudomonadota bacterium]